MLDFELFNEASLQISKILNTKKKKTVKSVIDIRENYNIIYKAPANLENLIQEKKKFDICINTTTLEHLTIDDLRYSLKHLKNLIKNKGFISSAIDYSDHYSHTDKKITSLNFLKFSNAEWKKYNNKYLFQNRLRHYDYKRLFEENGFVISKVTTGPKEFPKVKIAKEFDEKNKETFITWGYFLIQNN
jgi:predicted SAM-dependent methyltransferase